MRFSGYLRESERTYMDIINNEVEKSFRDFVRISRSFVYRGIPSIQSTADYAIKTAREDRKPMNMDAWTTSILDKLFEKKFGWRPRTTGIFTSSAESIALGYGKLCLFFPLGKYKYLFHPGINDLYTQMPAANKFSIELFCKRTDRAYPKKLADEIEEFEIAALRAENWEDKEKRIKFIEAMMEARLQFVVDGFKDNKLMEAMTQSTEIVWKCKNYLAIPSDEDTKKFILKGLSIL